MKTLFIVDPIEILDPEFDSSLGLLREFYRRGHETWACDVPDLFADSSGAQARAARIKPTRDYRYISSMPRKVPLGFFDLILMRKEPPFDAQYIAATYLLEFVPESVLVSNNPRGIRNTNEKAAIMHFPQWIPHTLLSYDHQEILEYQRRIKKDLVIKPLDLKGGTGIFLAKRGDLKAEARLRRLTLGGRRLVMAQEFLSASHVKGDKRILLLDGMVLAAYEKHFKKGEFRSNISLGGTIHPAALTKKEMKMVADLRPYLRREGIHLAGLDVMMDKLIEINVTCPAGLMEAKRLYPELRLAEAWADYLETEVRKLRTPGAARTRVRAPYR